MYAYNSHNFMSKTTIQLEKNTVRRLAKLGKFHSTYDSIVNKMIDHLENCSRLNEELKKN